MTGQDSILALRRSGQRPEFVWVTDIDINHLDGLTVKVCDDTPELLDLRFLLGVTAVVEGDDQKRVERITQACIDAKAKRVIASTHGMEGSWPAVLKVVDTEGVWKWPT